MAGIGGFYGYQWYKNLPVPEYTQVRTIPAPPTTLLPDAKPQPLTITFSRGVIRSEFINKSTAEQVELSPVIAGTWETPAADRITFTPKKDWPAGTQYTVSFKKTLFDRKALLKESRYSFTTPPLSVKPTSLKINEDVTDPTKRLAVGEFSLSHRVDRSSFEKRLTVLLNTNDATTGKKTQTPLTPTVTYSDNGDKGFR